MPDGLAADEDQHDGPERQPEVGDRITEEGQRELRRQAERVGTTHREHPQRHGEHEEQDDRQAVGRDGGEEERREESPAVEPASLEGGDGTHDVPDDPADDDRRQLERDAPGQRLSDQRVDRRRILRERRAEVSLQHVADVGQELLPHRLVESELSHVVLVDGLDRVSTRPTAPGHLGDESVDRIARDHSGQDEDDQHGRDEHDQVPADLAQEVARQVHCGCLRLLGDQYAQPPTRLSLNNHPMPAPENCGGAEGSSSVGKLSQLDVLNS